MKNWILGMALVVLAGSAWAEDAIPAADAGRYVVDTDGQSPIAQLGMGNAKVEFGRFVSQLQLGHPGEVVIKKEGGTYIIRDSVEAFMFEDKGADQVVIQKMMVQGQDVEADKVSASFALFLVNLGAQNRKKQ